MQPVPLPFDRKHPLAPRRQTNSTATNMKFILTFFALCLFATVAFAQRDYNLDLLANVGFPDEAGNDCWGYVDKVGREYAVMGTNKATYIFSLEDPTQPVLRARVAGATSIWRDIKSFGDYLYVIADQGADGLLVIDMTKAPETITNTFYKPTVTVGGQAAVLQKGHNLYISKEGLLVLAGTNLYSGAPLFFDLKTDPGQPPFVGAARRVYAHDVYAENGRLYSSDINAGQLTIHDYTDLGNIRALGSQTTSSSFTHNAWAKSDDRSAFTTDERSQATVDAYDVSDPTAIRLIDRFRPEESLTSGSIPHNTHVKGDFLVTSWYRDGVILTDATRPHNLIEVGRFDTYPQGSGNGFNGCWGAFPFLPSGLVIASDIESGLFVFRPQYEQGAYFEGTVQDSTTGELLSGVKVDFANREAQQTITGLDGNYATGIYQEGKYAVTFSKPGYLPRTVTADLRRGKLDFRNIKLFKILPVTFNVTVLDQGGRALPQANTSYEVTRVEGEFNVYDIAIGLWGYQPYVIRDTALQQYSTVDLTVRLKPGYVDDFFFDLGWESSGSAIRGEWERGIPEATDLDGVPAQLGYDVTTDFGDQAYATGLLGGAVGEYDVDGGTAILTSPLFRLPRQADARITFAYHFFDGGGATAPNDTLIVELVGGGRTTRLLEVRNSTTDWQRFASVPIRGLLGLTTPDSPPGEEPVEYRLVVRTGDLAQSGHIVEAMFDDFRLVEIAAPDLTTSANSGCAPFTVTYTIPATVGNPTFSIEGGSNTTVLGNSVTTTYETAGQYGLSVTTADAAGDPLSFRYPAAVTVGAKPAAAFGFNEKNELVVEFENTSTDATTFAWDFGDGVGSTEASPSHAYASAGIYTVRLIATSACGNDTVRQAIRAQVVGVDELSRITGLRVIENPVTSTLTIDYTLMAPIEIQLVDVQGRVLLSQNLVAAGRHELDVLHLPAGAYFLRVRQHPGAGATVIIQH